MRKVLPYLWLGALSCLCGYAFYYLSRKLSLNSSSALSETFEEEMKELKRWKEGVELQLANQFDRVKSLTGRLDRSKRKDSTSQEGPGSALDGPIDPGDLDNQATLNRIVAERFLGAGR